MSPTFRTYTPMSQFNCKCILKFFTIVVVVVQDFLPEKKEPNSRWSWRRHRLPLFIDVCFDFNFYLFWNHLQQNNHRHRCCMLPVSFSSVVAIDFAVAIIATVIWRYHQWNYFLLLLLLLLILCQYWYLKRSIPIGYWRCCCCCCGFFPSSSPASSSSSRIDASTCLLLILFVVISAVIQYGLSIPITESHTHTHFSLSLSLSSLLPPSLPIFLSISNWLLSLTLSYYLFHFSRRTTVVLTSSGAVLVLKVQDLLRY